MAGRSVSNSVNCWQINLHRSTTSFHLLESEMKRKQSSRHHIIFAQEPGRVIIAGGGGLFSFNTFCCTASPRAAIYASKSLGITVIREMSSRDVVVCSWETQNSKFPKILLISAYCDINTVPIHQKIIDAIDDYGTHVIVAVDTNAHSTLWGCDISNHRGKMWEFFLPNRNFTVLNRGSTPTFVTRRAESIIDVTLATNDLAGKIKKWKVCDDAEISDHRLLSFEINLNLASPKIWCRKKIQIDDDSFRAISDNWEAPDVWDIDTLESEVHRLYIDIKHRLDAINPMIKRRRLEPNSINWWNSDLEKLKQEQRRIEKQWQRNKCHETHSKLAEARRKLFSKIRQTKKASWRSYIAQIDSHRSTSMLVKAVNDKENRGVPVQVIGRDGKSCRSSRESLQVLLDTHFADNKTLLGPPFSYNINEPNLVMDCPIKLKMSKGNRCAVYCPAAKTQLNAELEQTFSLARVKKGLASFKPNKCPGPDGLRAEYISKFDHKTIDRISHIFKASVTISRTPTPWRLSSVIFLPKGNTRSGLPEAFRPISMTSFLFKTLEKLILRQIEKDINPTELYSQFQHAFSKGQGCELALARAVDCIEEGVYRKKKRRWPFH